MKEIIAIAFLIAAAPREQADDETVMPGEPGYVMKLTREAVRLGTARDHDRRVDLFLRAAEERVKEMRKAERKADASHRDGLAECYRKHVVQGAAGAIEQGAARGKDMSAAAGRYAEATAKHVSVLQAVLAKVPPQAQKGLLRALEASRHGHEQAVAAHERGKGKAKEKEKEKEREKEKAKGKEREKEKARSHGKGDDEQAPPDKDKDKDKDKEKKEKEKPDDKGKGKGKGGGE